MKPLLGWIALTSARLISAEAPDNASATIDASLAAAARTDPHWRTDIHAETGAAPPAPGRALARSPLLGLISYRPKTYAELSPDERSQWMHGEASRLPIRNRTVRFNIPPEEMRRSRPFVTSISPGP